jgi:hypothetical protein
MSFSIKKSHKFTDQFPNGKDSQKSNMSDILSEEDYLLFNLGDKPSGKAAARAAPAKPKKGGNCIRQVNSAQADYY